ncbi:BTB domain-containing protein [Mycena venus]|uniref:BTB domain-containing protein n=1 Tax=Mycena venus TaxID=2733690 RepID=A0A8H6YQP0_9AGAR|nr:BTB domain-containing protein [Mycena venus]
MNSAPPTKRRRTDDPDPPESPLVRSTEYWFDDGNIILQVESTQFRLTKGMLSMHSNVFRDMFMIPLPPDQPTIENCPVVTLSGDTPEDWNHLLGVMFPRSLLQGKPTAGLLAGVLRLSKKYDIPLFREDCIWRLKAEFPSTLKEHDKFLSWAFIRDESDILFPLASLAREIGLHSILPVIYYRIVASTGENGYMNMVLDETAPGFSTVDRLACMRGYIKLLDLQSQTTMSWLDVKKIPVGVCQQRPDCRKQMHKIIRDLHGAQRLEISAIHEWVSDWDTDLCELCTKEALKIFQDGRKECWNKLPSVFGLPEWDELKRLDLE